jgi:hypothetical protein
MSPGGDSSTPARDDRAPARRRRLPRDHSYHLALVALVVPVLMVVALAIPLVASAVLP